MMLRCRQVLVVSQAEKMANFVSRREALPTFEGFCGGWDHFYTNLATHGYTARVVLRTPNWPVEVIESRARVPDPNLRWEAGPISG